MDRAWRAWADPAGAPPLPTLSQLLPATAVAAAGGLRPTSGGYRKESAAEEARALAVLRASGAAAAEEQRTAAAAASAALRSASSLSSVDGVALPAQMGRQLRPFMELSYGYLPLVWAGTLAYYLGGPF